VEHDAAEIWSRARAVVAGALARAGLDAEQVSALGIAAPRDTTVLWDRATGKPVHNALAGHDTRAAALTERLGGADGRDRFRERTGLPLAPSLPGPRAAWLLENVPGLRTRARNGEIAFGTIGSWLVWNLTGGADGGRHVMDVTTAGHTLLMNLETLQWDPVVLEALDIPEAVLPKIRSSAEVYGTAAGQFAGVPVASAPGDQQAALLGTACFDAGAAKGTYGAAGVLMLVTGDRPAPSKHGLLTTVGYRIGDEPPVYCLEGTVPVAGALVEWFRDRLGLIRTADEIETLAAGVEDNGGAYVVPAFSGLSAPHWRPDARGVITGLTRYVTKAHLARAALEAVAWQTREVLDAMHQDCGVPVAVLRAHGGMARNGVLMQNQADVLGVPVARPRVSETACLGAAFAAGLATGVWGGLDEVGALWRKDAEWTPRMEPAARDRAYRRWRKAVERSLGWQEGEAAAGC
jgi:glycerol kinase